jgi:hypothetical protein
MKKNLTIFFFLISFILCSQTENDLKFKTISGFISFQNKKLSNVSVFVEGTTRFAVSNSKGFYSIKAKAGEILSFSYIDLKTTLILVEDITAVLNIKMKINNNRLQQNRNKPLMLGGSSIGDYTSDFVVTKIKGENLNKNATTLTEAIIEKIPDFFVKLNNFGEEIIYLRGKELMGPVTWNFDGYFFDIPIPVYISEVTDIIIVNSNENGCIIKVNTNINYDKITDINYDNFHFIDDDYYNYDAILYKKIKIENPLYLVKYKKLSKKKETLNLYLKTYTEDKNKTNFHFNILNFLKKEKFNKDIVLKVLSDFEDFSNNPEDLKAIAYRYQELNENTKALSVYKKIAKLRPNHAQSFRDLANVYLELKQYRNASLTYKYLFKKGFIIQDNDISAIVESEMISNYYKDKDNKNNLHKITTDNPKKNINSDVRVVFEWNTTEAEFILEFVNPDNYVYTIENSMYVDEGLIFDQKEKGYTSKEIFIKELNRGNYLVNFTYLENKQNKPTILKTTTYYNWGRPNQRKKIEAFDFTLENIKVQLLKLNRRNFK